MSVVLPRTIGWAAGLVAAIVGWPLLFGRRLVGGFHAVGDSYLWNPGLVSLHVISDAVIGLSFVAMSLTLAYLVYRGRQRLRAPWPFLTLGAFLLACGATHFVGILTIWVPAFWFAGTVKVVTALVSVMTAVALLPLVPKVLALVESAAASENRKTQLEATHRELAVAEASRKSESDRAELLEREREARAQAEAANRTKDEFLASVSHELRTPLNAMLGWSRMLRDGTLKPEDTSRALETIERNARVQAQLIEDLLDVSRIITGKLRLDVRPVEPLSVIESAVEAVRPAADAKEIHILAPLDPLPEPISGDPDRLQQVVWNLLSNAIKFTPRGGHVEVRLERVDSHVHIVVTDSGQGIESEFLPHVFERFSQADRSLRRHGGLGLGLGIVRHLTELHGGTVDAVSAGLNQGATFTVKLPLMPVRVRSRRRDQHPSRGGTGSLAQSSALKGLHILVVDDDRDARDLLSAVLGSAGAQVTTVGSAAEALLRLEENQPNLIVSDIHLPDQDGYGFIREVRVREAGSRRTPAVALTAYARAQDRMDALRAGFEMHVPKPVEPAELVMVIAALVGRTHQL